MARFTFACLLVLVTAAGRAAEPDTKVLSIVLRDLLAKNIPIPALESKKDWGHQKEVTTGVTFKKLGPAHWVAVPQKGMKNDGHWQVFKGTVEDPVKTLKLTVSDVTNPAPGTTAFKAALAAEVAFTYEQQIWKYGARLYSGETRGTCKMAVVLACEAAHHLERNPDSLVPALVVRLKVTSADLSYSDLAVDHTLGVGGDAAKLLGEAAVGFVKAVKPNMEKGLLAKANAAVVKAADSKDVRVELDKLFEGKNPVVKGK